MQDRDQPLAICGTAFHTPYVDTLEILEDVLIEFDGTGTILNLLQPRDTDYARAKAGAAEAGRLVVLRDGQYLLPGLVDLHVHAPQWPQTGKALNLPLADWLHAHTFPLEARYADRAFAQRIYPSLVGHLLANGTTTALYFATIHHEASLALAEICLEKGQRAVIGRVAMDDPRQCPEYYRDPSAAAGIDATRRFNAAVRALPGNGRTLVMPCVTPRFIPSCTDRLLAGLGEIARTDGCHVQTHCSESDWAARYTIDRFGRSDTEVLRDMGLLTRQSVLAHGNFMSLDDFDLVHRHGAGIAHCPLSNFYFANSVFPARSALANGVHVGLGTDIAGGHSPSILDACRHALAASRALGEGVDPGLSSERRGTGAEALDPVEAFWLATAGGAEVLDLPVGSFQTGKQFDAICVDLAAAHSNLAVWEDMDGLPDVFQKIVYNAGRANIAHVWVAGRQVHG